MSSSLKEKTVKGLSWSFVDTMAGQGIAFIVSIILARLLTPKEFGLIGMATIFIAISNSFIDSGFRSALIRKTDANQTDYSTVFYFNLLVGIILFLILWGFAGPFSGFFKEPQLKPIIQALGVILVISSLTLIQQTILIKRIDFKLQAKISLLASIISGGIALVLAFKGFGVWALVIQQISKQAINSLLLWLWNRWKPSWVFSKQSFKELFGFGSKLLVSGLIDTAYRNIYYIVIGKYFSAEALGFYTRANDFKRLPADNLLSIISKVTYPVLATIQDDLVQLKEKYRRLIRTVMFFTFTLILGMGAVAHPLIFALIGEKWEPAVLFLQILVFQGMMYPLQALNLNMLQVQGRSDLFLKLEIIKKVLAVPTIIIGVIFGMKWLLISMVVYGQIAYALNSYWSGKQLNYSYLSQIKDILPSFLLAFSMSAILFLTEKILPFSNWANLFILIVIGAAYVIGLSELIRFKDYLYTKNLVIQQFHKIFAKK